jgi:hypothetical protein
MMQLDCAAALLDEDVQVELEPLPSDVQSLTVKRNAQANQQFLSQYWMETKGT